MKNYIKILITLSFLLTACSHTILLLEDKITQPVLKEEPKLIYPFTAQQENKFGTSIIVFSISKEGKVEKTQIQKSSGVKDLDNAAEYYCKGLFFSPAKVNGEPIASKMKWTVKFNLKEFKNEIKDKITEVKELYSKAEQLEGSAKRTVQNEILMTHNYIIQEIKDAVKFNEYMYGVVQKNIKNDWEHLTGYQTLTFLLYHDFLIRFGNYDSLCGVQSRFEHALKKDLDYLSVSSNIGNKDKINRDTLILKISRFVEKNYPNLKLDELDLGMKFKNNSVS